MSVIESIPRGVFFRVAFYKKDGTFREATAQLGVYNTKNPKLTPKGTGETSSQALSNGRLKFYEPHHRNADGSLSGEYRQCSISKIVSITTNKQTYEVED